MLKKNIIFATLLTGLLAVSADGAKAQTPQEVLSRGRSLFDFGRWSDAREEFRLLKSSIRPEHHTERELADFYLAACAVELGSEEAEQALLKFMKEYPNSTLANDVHFSLGSLYCASGEMAAAHEEFAKTNYNALSRQRREQYDVRMGYVEFSQKNYKGAYDHFERIGSRSEYADHALYYMSYIDYLDGKTGRAKQGFQRLASSDAYRDLAPYFLLQMEFREGNYRYVTEHGEQLAEKAVGERRGELFRSLAESWFRLDDFNKCIHYLDRFTSEGGELDREGSYLMGFSLYRTARYENAETYLKRACGAKDALTQNASYHLADCYLRRGDKSAAMHSFGMAADENFDRQIAEDALFNYAKLQYELGGGLFNGAINVLTRYVETYPASERMDEARTLLIAAYYNSRDYDAAYNAIKSSKMTDSETRAALQKITYFRALEAFSKRDYSEAKSCLAESAAINVSPKYGALNAFWQGEIAFKESDYTVAAMKYNAYLKRAPKTEREYAMALYNLGYCSLLRGDIAVAGDHFSKFLSTYYQRDGYRADAYNRMGDVLYAQRRFSDAVAQYDKAIAIGTPERHYSLYKLAETQGVLGHMSQKQQTLRRIISAGEGDYVDVASYELGRTYILEERYSEGARQLEGFVRDFPQSPLRVQALSDLGLAWLNLGDKQKSLSYYNMIVESAPQSAEAREAMQGIREIYVSDGRVDDYFQYAEKTGLEGDLSAVTRDSLSFVSAQKLYLADKRDEAEKSLRSYLKSYPKGYYKSDALYYLSDCYLRGGNRDEAISTMQELVGVGAGQYAPAVLEKLSKMTYEDKRYGEAADAFRRLYDVSSGVAQRADAMAGYARATIKEGDKAKIEAMAADVTQHKDAGKVALREARFAWAEIMRNDGRGTEAVKLYRELAKEVSSKEGSAAAYYVIESMYRAGETDKVEKAVFAYSERQPSSYWLAKAFLLLGDVYQKKGDAFQARATWQSVVDGYSPADDGIVDEARERIKKLN